MTLRWRTVLLGAGALVALSAAGLGVRQWRAAHAAPAAADTTRAPAGLRVVVEVLNASGVPGQARRASFLLRDRGFDVVAWGNDASRGSETVIEDITGKPEVAERLARVLGGARIERGQDSLQRALDVRVKVGSGFRLPPGVFYP